MLSVLKKIIIMEILLRKENTWDMYDYYYTDSIQLAQLKGNSCASKYSRRYRRIGTLNAYVPMYINVYVYNMYLHAKLSICVPTGI